MSKDNNTSNKVGFTGLLTIALIVLKLCKVITWSWVWVLSPIWITATFAIVVLIFLLIAKGWLEHEEDKTDKR